jgi:hypothetical protein
MPTQREKIIKKVSEVLENKQNGIRYSELFREIKNLLPEVPENTIHGNIWDLDKEVPEIIKPERGVFILKKYIKEGTEIKLKEVERKVKTPSEDIFYGSFADYLINDLEECTKAIPLGGNKFGDKWGTPDVFGVYRFTETDPVKPPLEIVSAEIKTDANQLITAFGQACSYKLFSHKVYLVIPEDAERDVGRIESLCLKFGLGLILFDKNNPKNPNYNIRTRAIKDEPDFFYVNKYLRLLEREAEKLF